MKYPTFIFAKKKFLRDWDERVRVAFNKSSREFYRTVWMSVPVRTGMARGSLVPLGRELKNVPTSIAPVIDWEASTPKRHYPKGKDLAAGIKLGEDAYLYESGNGKFTLVFDIKVFHYILNEAGLAKVGPWWTLPAGREAFKQAMKDSGVDDKLRKLLSENLKVRTVRK